VSVHGHKTTRKSVVQALSLYLHHEQTSELHLNNSTPSQSTRSAPKPQELKAKNPQNDPKNMPFGHAARSSSTCIPSVHRSFACFCFFCCWCLTAQHLTEMCLLPQAQCPRIVCVQHLNISQPTTPPDTRVEMIPEHKAEGITTPSWLHHGGPGMATHLQPPPAHCIHRCCNFSSTNFQTLPPDNSTLLFRAHHPTSDTRTRSTAPFRCTHGRCRE
jgi:hypothetical protein